MEVLRRSGAGGGAGAEALNDLTDVNLSGLADGDILRYDDAGTFKASLSPLSYGGTDYQNGAFGSAGAPIVLGLFGFSPEFIDADDTAISPNAGSFAGADIAVCLITPTGMGSPYTLYISNGFATAFAEAETLAGYQAALRSAVGDAGLVIDNFKLDYFTYNSATTDYTHNGFTGFDIAGAVAVVGANTTPPTIAYFPGTQKFVNVDLPQRLYMNTDNVDNAQTVSTASETPLEFMDSGLSGTGASYFFDETASEMSFDNGVMNNTDDLIMLIDVREVSGEFNTAIGSGILRLKRLNSSMSYETIATAENGQPLSVSPHELTSDQFQITLQHTEGGDIDVVTHFIATFDKPTA